MNRLQPRRHLRREWLAPALLPLVVILMIGVWSDLPQYLVAAFLPTFTPAGFGVAFPTLVPTHTPTETARFVFPAPTGSRSEAISGQRNAPAGAAAARTMSNQTPSQPPTLGSKPSKEPTPALPPRPIKIGTFTPTPAGKGQSGKWIEVDLSKQRLYAHEGSLTVFVTRVSGGTRRSPTVTGRFKICDKYAAARMRGPGYDLPDVPWTMYFSAGYAIHGAYWHNNFGQPMSHGCINMRVNEAKWLYNWAPKGTLVVIHR